MQGAADFNLRQSHATAAADGDAAVSRRAFLGQTAFLAGMAPSVANAFDFKTVTLTILLLRPPSVQSQ